MTWYKAFLSSIGFIAFILCLPATVQSFILPGVRYNRTGFPSASTTAWILVLRPPFESPISWFVTLFSAPF